MTITKDKVFMAVGKAIKAKQVKQMENNRPYGALEVTVEVEDIVAEYCKAIGVNVEYAYDSDVRDKLTELTHEDELIEAVNKEIPYERAVVRLTSDGLAQFNFNVT